MVRHGPGGFLPIRLVEKSAHDQPDQGLYKPALVIPEASEDGRYWRASFTNRAVYKVGDAGVVIVWTRVPLSDHETN
jgi:hypothetical protein